MQNWIQKSVLYQRNVVSTLRGEAVVCVDQEVWFKKAMPKFSFATWIAMLDIVLVNLGQVLEFVLSGSDLAGWIL